MEVKYHIGIFFYYCLKILLQTQVLFWLCDLYDREKIMLEALERISFIFIIESWWYR
jgi:hypothetical protein